MPPEVHEEIWSSFEAYLQEKGSSLHRGDSSLRNNWFNFNLSGRRIYGANAKIFTKNYGNRVNCEIYIGNNIPFFEFLEKHKEEMEKALEVQPNEQLIFEHEYAAARNGRRLVLLGPVFPTDGEYLEDLPSDFTPYFDWIEKRMQNLIYVADSLASKF